jgi:hypothetical protein
MGQTDRTFGRGSAPTPNVPQVAGNQEYIDIGSDRHSTFEKAGVHIGVHHSNLGVHIGV